MDAASKLEGLPSEVLILIMRSSSSPIDLQSVINASPVMFRHYLVHRSHIMAPTIHRIKTSYSALHSGSNLIQSINTLTYRMLGNTHGPVVRREAFYTNWGSHLPLICELYRQKEEADQLITEYSMKAWKNFLVSEEQDRLQLNLASKRDPIVDRPLVLSEQETYTFERGFLLYESWRLHMHSNEPNDLEGLGALKCHDSGNVPGPHPNCMDPWWAISDDRLYLHSIWSFVFDKFRTLVQSVSQQLRKNPSRSPIMSSSEDNQTSAVFLRMTKAQELRYIRSLCLRGYVVLQNLRQMKEEELQNYVLSSYFEFENQEATLYSSAESAEKRCVDLNIACRLYGLFVNDGLLLSCFTEGRYFWDDSRKLKVRA
ncbi:hypothetical protein FANTH_3281 [Fusarium anthophilum]|uniref:Uncharacterized protein n=1 Tax=Fusarium anthophilum TaxID=48485 RepID=A0A8H4ZT08_9HYPO|nr:hypothetical protein FANTH_3281 [Fusarium anthophilum]